MALHLPEQEYETWIYLSTIRQQNCNYLVDHWTQNPVIARSCGFKSLRRQISTRRIEFYKRRMGSYFRGMKTLLNILAVISVSWFTSPAANADAVATLSGVVKNAKGQPVHGAEIRIMGKDASKVGKVHTDANGRYSYPGLETGTYSVMLVVALIGFVKKRQLHLWKNCLRPERRDLFIPNWRSLLGLSSAAQ